MTNSTDTFVRLSTATLESAFRTKYLFFTGKGGVGKTSIACASAVTLATLGKRVLLISTDPASNLDETFGVTLTNHPTPVPTVTGLKALNIDPEAAAEEYRQRVIAPLLATSTKQEISGLREQLSGACTFEIAAFDEFAALLSDQGVASEFDTIIFDTAPTGHTLLLLDAAGSYHREMLKKMEESAPGKLTTPLMMLQDAAQTKVLLVTLAETTPVSEAATLQGDLLRASIKPYGWVVNRSLAASATTDVVLLQRAANEHEQLERILHGLAERVAILPLMAEEPVGVARLQDLLANEGKNG